MKHYEGFTYAGFTLQVYLFHLNNTMMNVIGHILKLIFKIQPMLAHGLVT